MSVERLPVWPSVKTRRTRCRPKQTAAMSAAQTPTQPCWTTWPHRSPQSRSAHMTQSSASARCIAMLLLLSALALMGCKPSLTRPETVQTPPLVLCDAEPLSPIPPIPALADMDAWAVSVMGLYEIAATRLSATNTCLRNLRADGVIR